MVKVRVKNEPKPLPVVNLPGHHAQCEMNYHLCMPLVPGCRSGQRYWAFTLGEHQPLQITVKLKESGPYTSTIDIEQGRDGLDFVHRPRIRVRLYHDVEMAEIVGWDRHRHWLPLYNYPNSKMYHSDEKLALNRFLGEWLLHCRKLGCATDAFCEYSRITKK